MPSLSKDTDVLLPTTQWPFDHAMLVTRLVACPPAEPHAGGRGWSVPTLGLLGKASTRTAAAPDADTADSFSTERSHGSSSRHSTERSTTRSRDTPQDAVSAMMRDLCRSPAHTLWTLNNFLQISLITLWMGALEIDDRRLLFAFMLSVVLVIAVGILALLLEERPTVALVASSLFVATSLGLFCLMQRFSLKVEGLDRFAWRFDAERKKLLDGVATDERGPPSFSPDASVRQPSADLEANLARAAELLEPFYTDVLAGLANVSGDPTQPREVRKSLKQPKRAYEKARLDYHGDGARVTDLLRGCVVCATSISEIRAAYAYLQELERQGTIRIVQNKNRCTPLATPRTCPGWVGLQPASSLLCLLLAFP